MVQPASLEGALPSGSRYLIQVPAAWNGVLLLWQRPLPVQPGDPPWEVEEPLAHTLLDHGYGLAGSANTIFWPLERCFADQLPLLEEFERLVGRPEHTIPFGLSIGGIMTAGLVQLFPERLSAALPLCGNLAGAVATHNRELDIAFVVKALLAPDSALHLVRIGDPEANIRVAMPILHDARSTLAGRARLALAAAVGSIPTWWEPDRPRPAADDLDARVEAQFGWFEEPGFFVYFAARAQVERQARGNPSWNTGVDYRKLLVGSRSRDLVEALYAQAGLELDVDLDALAAAPRIEADPSAVAYLERHIVFDGDLGGLPVLAMHTVGDGLVPPENVRAYADVVSAHGDAELLRCLYVDRAGHCTFSIAEVLTALDALRERMEVGSWGELVPERLNARAAALHLEAGAMQVGGRYPPAFCTFEPPRFLRPYDQRVRQGKSPRI